MIAEVILNNAVYQPDKVAISYGDETITYSNLATKIQQICFSSKANSKILLDGKCPIRAIAALLACQLTGRTGLIIQSDIPKADETFLIEKQGFKHFDSATDEDSSTELTAKNPFFLGVLTAGSTGVPKVILKDNDCWEKAFAHQSNVFGISADDTILVLDAIAYSANLNAILHGLWVGATVTLCSLTKAHAWGELIVNKRITSVFMVPSHLNLLSDVRAETQIKSIVTAGEKLSSSLASSLLALFPGLLLTEYYGTAELGHVSYHQNKDICENPISVGRAFPEVKISIENNQLYVDSPYVSPEYRSLKTVGDLGTWQDGNLVLLGRAGKMFNRRGLNIFAQEIEQKAMANAWVKEACLVETLRNDRKKLVLFFSVNEHVPVSEDRADSLKKYLNALLPLAKRPSQLVQVPTFPRFSNGKVNEKGLRLLLNYVDEDAVI